MKNTVYKNASVVTGLSVAERGLGFLYRIVLSRLIGAEGLGLYQVALSLFSLFLTIGTGGLPITLSRMLTKSKAEHRPNDGAAATAAGFTLALLLTLPFAILLFLFGGKLGFLFSDERAFRVFRILLLGLCLSSIYAVVRGYFWGQKEFLLPSILEIAEESVMVIVGVVLLQNVASPSSGAEKAAWAVVISYLFSFTASLVCFFVKGGKLASPKSQLKPLFNATMPITSVRASSSLVNSAVAVLLPLMLVRAGMKSGEATALFGIVSGMVLPLLFMPSTLIGSLSLVLVPELAEDYYKHNHERLIKNVERGLKFAFLVACALIPIFFALGKEIGQLAFSNETAGELLVTSAVILLPMSLTMISTSMLNSMGFEKQTFLFYFLGAAALLVSVLLLPAICGIYAYVIGLGASFTVTAVCNLVFLRKCCPYFERSALRRFLPVLLSVVPLSVLGQLLSLVLDNFLGAFGAAAVTCIVLAMGILSVFVWTKQIEFRAVFSKFRHKKGQKQ